MLPPIALVALAIPLILLGIHYSSPGNPGTATGPNVNEPGLEQPKAAPFTKANQRAVHRVLREFILTAVDRRDVARSWEISAPSMKEGFTRKQWNRGELPVVPYPAANRGLGDWSFVQYSYADTVGLEVFLFPKPGSGWSAMTADVELVKGHDGRWRVDYWMPKRFHGPPAVAATAKASPKKHEAGQGRSRAQGGRQADRRSSGGRRDSQAEPYLVDRPDRAARADRARPARDRNRNLDPQPPRGPRVLAGIDLGLRFLEQALPAGDQAL